MRWIALVVAVGLAAAPANAETRWSTGLNLRPELGTHPLRIGVGVEHGLTDLAFVLDPMFVFDGQHDIDLLAGWRACEAGWGAIAGWRTSAIGLVGGNQLQQKLVIGLTAPLPSPRRLRIRWALELATVVVKHGADLPTDWISFATGRDFVDLINVGTFVRIDHVSGPR
jgi:hypothetical protein